MTKNILLTAVAVGALAFAGAASAHTLTFRTVAAGGGIDSTDLGGAAAYRLALESNSTADENNFLLLDTLSAGSSLPSGNVLVTVNITGADWDIADFTGGDLRGGAGCTSFTAALSNVTTTQAIFVVSNSTPGCASYELDVPVNSPTGTGDVVVTTDIRTDGVPGTPIDNPQGRLVIIQQVSAFGVDIDGDIGSGALNDTIATLTQLPVYTEFLVGGIGHDGVSETDDIGQLGTIELTVDTTAHRDLANPLIFVSAADVDDADVTVTGNFAAFNGAGDATLLTTYDSLAGNVATYEDRQADLTAGAVAYRVDADGAPSTIPSSPYSATVAYVLDPAFYDQEGPVTDALETIGRDGTNVILPWMNSSSLQATNGTTNIVRLGNVGGSTTGPVFAQVLNSTTGLAGAAPVQLFPNILAGGERVIDTATLTGVLGEFGRGDIQISVEAPANTITARRFAFLANGSVTELSNGTVASDQTPADVNDVP